MRTKPIKVCRCSLPAWCLLTRHWKKLSKDTWGICSAPRVIRGCRRRRRIEWRASRQLGKEAARSRHTPDQRDGVMASDWRSRGSREGWLSSQGRAGPPPICSFQWVSVWMIWSRRLKNKRRGYKRPLTPRFRSQINVQIHQLASNCAAAPS